MAKAWRKQSHKIEVDAETKISSVWAVPNDFKGDVFVLAHGAGNDMNSPFLSYVHEAVADRGMLSVKFNFPYTEMGRKAPDRAPRLEQTWRAVLDRIRRDDIHKPKRLFASGKSMGGRIASMIAAEGEAIDGLVFLGYPLHPPGKTEKLRSEHLSRIPCPMLFIQGSRDRLCQLDLLQQVLKPVKTDITLHVIDEGDHSFKVPKRTGRSEQDIWQEIIDVVDEWTHNLRR